jgi:hypothetical protein
MSVYHKRPKGRKRKPARDIDWLRRWEIERYARYIGACETDDFESFLVEWARHNQHCGFPIFALQDAAARMSRRLTLRPREGREWTPCFLSEEDAWGLIEQSDEGPRLKADALGKRLGLTYRLRELLGIKTIGAKDVGKRARNVLRKRKARIYAECKRRERGAKPQSQSLSRTKPWEVLKMSRRTWYRQRTKMDGTTSSAIPFLNPIDKVVPAERAETNAAERRYAPSKQASQPATTIVADIPISRVPPSCFGMRPTTLQREAA